MNKDWLDKVNMTQEEREMLEMWCKNIGYKQYEKIFRFILEKTQAETVGYAVLKAIAKYEFCISDFLHSMIKFIELRFRSYLCNHYGSLLINKKDFLYQISNELGEGERRLDCSTYYDKKLKDETTLEDFLLVSSMETVLRVFFVLPNKELELFNSDIEELKRDLYKIKEMRNYVAHGQVLLFNTRINLKDTIVTMLKYMPTNETKIKRIDELESINKRLLKDEGGLPDTLLESTAVLLGEGEKKEIGL